MEIPRTAAPAYPPAPGVWQTDTPVQLWPTVWRLTAPNPGVMTGPGTNSYLIGDAAHGFTVIDPGPADAGHLQRLWRAARHLDGTGGHVARIVCTHSHPDHAPGAYPLQALCDSKPPVAGMPSAPTARAASSFVPDVPLLHGEWLAVNPLESQDKLLVIHTPGHAANHVCLALPTYGVLFSGDHVLNGSTTVVDPPDGNMTQYIDSLDVLLAACAEFGLQYILPAHGHVLQNAVQAIAHLKAHRLRREAKIASIVQGHPNADVDTWLAMAYGDVPQQIWPIAKRSLLAHLERIALLKSAAS